MFPVESLLLYIVVFSLSTVLPSRVILSDSSTLILVSEANVVFSLCFPEVDNVNGAYLTSLFVNRCTVFVAVNVFAVVSFLAFVVMDCVPPDFAAIVFTM